MILNNFSLFILSSVLLYLSFCLLPTAYRIFELSCVLFIGMWVSYGIAHFLKKTFFNKKLPPTNKAVFITGCDSGFGHELAKRLDLLGYQVFAGCFDSKGGGPLNLTETCSSNLTIVPIDVTSDQSVEAAKQFVTKNLNGNVLWGVVNNAGVPQAGEIDWTSTGDLKEVWEVNTFGTVRVTKAFLSLLRASKGRLVNTTSSVGRFICPGFVGYCMSKSAAIVFTEGLQLEIEKWGVKTISIEPFFYKTNITSQKTANELIDRTWSKADPETRQDYGESYLNSFKSNSDFLLYISSTKINQVIDCFEDALTAEEPQSSYFPAYLPHKIGILFFKVMPASLQEQFQRTFFDRKVKPAALTPK